MGNMGYCRFENTLSDLRDCYENMDDPDDLSPEEQRARMELLRICSEIVVDYQDEIE